MTIKEDFTFPLILPSSLHESIVIVRQYIKACNHVNLATVDGVKNNNTYNLPDAQITFCETIETQTLCIKMRRFYVSPKIQSLSNLKTISKMVRNDVC